VFCSGYSYSASAYGLPDVGYVNWHDITEFATKIRHALPNTHVLVDVDDGFGDEVVAANTIRNLESNGLSAVMMEDQKRPRRCGHFEGKIILPIEEYLVKLSRVIETRSSIFVIARTDASDQGEAIERAIAYAEAGADGVMVGRAAQGRPWLFREIAHYLATGEHLAPPAAREIGAVLVEHLDGLYDLYGGEHGARVARKHIGWTVRALPGGEALRSSVNVLQVADAQRAAVNDYFERLAA